jgi:hypothetical protein
MRVALVARLLTHRKQAITDQQALAQLVVDLLRRRPARRLALGGELGEDLRIERVGLGSPPLGKCDATAPG